MCLPSAPLFLYEKRIVMIDIDYMPDGMLWRPVRTMEELCALEPVSQDFHDALERMRLEGIVAEESDTLKLLNKSFEVLTRWYYCHPSLETWDEERSDIIYYAHNEMGWDKSGTMVMATAYWMSRLVSDKALWLAGDFECEIVAFASQEPFWAPLGTLAGDLSGQHRSIEYPFRLRPCAPEAYLNSSVNWERITKGYQPDTLVELIELWNPLERQVIAGIIGEAMTDYHQQAQAVVGHYGQGLPMRYHLQRLRPITLTLREIVDYCKRRLAWEDVRQIVGMLNHLLRRRLGDQDAALIDSVEESFRERQGRLEVNINSPGNYIAREINMNK